MADKGGLKIGTRAQIKEKDLLGQVAYVGLTEFAAGKWIGIILDEPKGKNNGTVQGKQYFNCEDKHGMFVRQTQITVMGEETSSRPASRASLTAADKSPKGGGAVTPTSETGGAITPVMSRSNTATPTRIAQPRSGLAKPGSRLPMPGRGPTGSRSPSYTNLKAAKAAQKEGATPHSGLRKERSFIEKNFVETLNQPQPKMTPGTPASSSKSSSSAPTPQPFVASPALTERLEEKVANLQAQQELQKAVESIRDLEEKLETLKVKRAKDQEKIKDFEKIKIQHEQLLEFKSRIMESQSQLQKELQKAKHDAREAIEAKDKHADEMAELSETVEMATLDKEMAEEKAETLQIELEASKEKVEELTLDLDIIKAEMGDGTGKAAEGSSEAGGMTNFEVKQQIAQNEKLRETLVRMRDLLAHEKNENLKFGKDVEEKSTQVTELTKINEKVTVQNTELEATIADLQEQVDASLGAEEMVENLTTKCLDWEEKYAALVEERDDLEKLHDLNEELQEDAREVEQQLREDSDLAQGKIREMTRARDAAYEIIGDHETTIKKFRELVNKVQEQNLDLRAALEKETNKPVSTPAEMIDFKKMFAETKAHSKAIDMELRTCEVQQATQHVRYLSSYMSDTFMARGGDNEAVLVLLLIPRMMWKADILISQLKENFSAPETIDKSTLLKGHDIDKYTYGTLLQHYLESLVAQLQQFSSALATCTPELFLKMGTLYPEMSVHERSVDFYIDLLRKNQLDENAPMDAIEKSLNYFQHIYPLHLGTQKLDHPTFLSTHVKAIVSASEALSVQFTIGQLLLQEGQESSEMGTFLKTSEHEVAEIKSLAKSMKRRMPAPGSLNEALVLFPSSTALKFTEIVKEFTPLVKAMYLFGKTGAQQAGLQGESFLPTTKISELLHQAIDKVYEFNEAGLDTIKNTLNTAMGKMSELNKVYQEGDWDIESVPGKPVAPVILRSEAYKGEIKEAEGMKIKVENKDADIKELRLLVRAKGEEMSEMQVRKDKAEKKLLDATRDSELMREKLQRKLDDMQSLMKRKEKEFEETMDHLQTDIDSLENERGELKNKLKDITKKTLIEGITKSHAFSASAAALAGSGAPSMVGSSSGTSSLSGLGPMSLGPSVPMPVKDSPMLLQQLQEMQTALLTMKENSYRVKGEEMRKRLANMKPLHVPKKLLPTSPGTEKADESKDDKSPDIADLMKRATVLRNEINKTLLSPKVVNLRKNGSIEAVSALVHQQAKHHKLKLEAEKLQLEVAKLRASKLPGGEVQSAFCKFPSPQFGKALSEDGYTCVGNISLNSSYGKTTKATMPEIKTIPLIVGLQDLRVIHQTVMA